MTIPSPDRWATLSPLLDELLDLAEPQRGVRLLALRAGDPALANELQALLSEGAQAASEGFLAGAVPLTPGEGAASSLAGQHLGPYVLEEPLGQGGGGSVWRARREDGRFEGAVAIKLLHLSLLGRAGAERFRREGHILALLKHPHIASLLDAGVTPGGQPYLVLELVQGERIDRHCDALSLSIEARLALFSDVLAAVAHAHTHGVIHRDLKPGNILVTREGQVKLLDFGVAKLLDDEASSGESTELTRQGGRALTPEYAAPEQLRGEAVTTATDVYALGVLLYQLLCGQHPTAPTGGGAPDALRATLDTEPTPASRRLTITDDEAASRRASSPQRLQRELAGDLDTIVSHALRKAPGERYATVAALAEDLRRYRDHEPVIARPDSVAYRARKFVRRHRGAVAAGVLTSLAIVAGVAGTVWQAQRAQEASHQARAERDRALAELNHAQAAQDLLSFMVSDSSDKAVTASELLDRTQAMVEKGYASQPQARARLLLMLGSQRVILGQRDKGRAVLERGRSAAVEVHDPVLTASIDCVLGQLYTMAGQFDTAKSMIDASLQLLDRRRETEVTAVTDCLSARVVLHKETNRADAAVADAREALRLEGRSGLRRDVQTVYLRAALASTLRMQGHRALAVEELRLALAELDALGRGQTASAAVLWNNLGAALSGGGQIKAATSALQTGLILRRTVSGSAVDPVGLANLGFNQAQMGQLDQALETLTLAMSQAQAAGNPLETGFVGQLLAATLHSAGQFEAADTQLAAARRQLLPLLKPGDPTWAMLGLQAGRLALARGDAKEAQAQFAAAQEVLDHASSNHLGRFRVTIDRARATMALGDSAAAQAFAEKALVQAQRFSEGFATSDFLGEAHLLLAELAFARGQTRQAVELGNRAVVHYEASLGEDAPVAAQAKALVKRWAKTA